jgi:hypothetical protein
LSLASKIYIIIAMQNCLKYAQILWTCNEKEGQTIYGFDIFGEIRFPAVDLRARWMITRPQRYLDYQRTHLENICSRALSLAIAMNCFVSFVKLTGIIWVHN